MLASIRIALRGPVRRSVQRSTPGISLQRAMSSTHEERMQHARDSPPLCLAYVKKHAEPGNAKSVVDAIDVFASTRGMMNVGSVKGAVVDEQIRARKPLIMAELGAYSGYSAVRFASLQREVAGSDSHYYSFEYSPEFAAVVKEMVAFAGMEDQVTVFTGAFADQYHQLAGKKADVVFIDHEKSCYLSDAKLMLQSGMLQKGSLLLADNVLYPGAPDYLAYMEANTQFKTVRNNIDMSIDGNAVADIVLASEFLGY